MKGEEVMVFFKFWGNKTIKKKIVNYQSPNVPSWYKCSSCSKIGVKLWRKYDTSKGPDIDLFCVYCGLGDQDLDVNIHREGYFDDGHGRSFILGELVPAVPSEDGTIFWGFTVAPDEGAVWWKKLPL